MNLIGEDYKKNLELYFKEKNFPFKLDCALKSLPVSRDAVLKPIDTSDFLTNRDFWEREKIMM